MHPLGDPTTSYVRFAWIDLVNCVRYRVMPISNFRALVRDQDVDSDAAEYDGIALDGSVVATNTRPGIHVGKAVLGMINLKTVPMHAHDSVSLPMLEGKNHQKIAGLDFKRPMFGAVGEYVLVPDRSSARHLQYAPSHVLCFGWFEEKTARITRPKDSLLRNPFESTLCPRSILRRVVEAAYQSHGAEFLVGFESEVVFLRKDLLNGSTTIRGANEYGYSESHALLAGEPETLATSEIADAIQNAGIELQMYHSEVAPGQFEFVTGPLRPVEACDALVVTREIIRNIANKHGFCATLAPRLFSNSCGSATHAHMSIPSSRTSSRRTLVPDQTGLTALSGLEQSFLAGLLEHLPATTALTLPTSASYGRMVDGLWTGGTYVSWGRDNREVPVRICGRGNINYSSDTGKSGTATVAYNAPDDVHFEVKCMDGTATPYIAIAGLLAAGMLGVHDNAKLKHVGIDLPAAELEKAGGAEVLAELGITQRMPCSTFEAREALVKDTALAEALGGLESVVQPILAAQQLLDKELDAPTEEERVRKLIMKF